MLHLALAKHGILIPPPPQQMPLHLHKCHTPGIMQGIISSIYSIDHNIHHLKETSSIVMADSIISSPWTPLTLSPTLYFWTPGPHSTIVPLISEPGMKGGETLTWYCPWFGRVTDAVWSKMLVCFTSVPKASLFPSHTRFDSKDHTLTCNTSGKLRLAALTETLTSDGLVSLSLGWHEQQQQVGFNVGEDIKQGI